MKERQVYYGKEIASHLRSLGKILEPWICQQIFMIWSYTSAKLQWTGCFKDHCYPCSCTDDEEQHSRYYTFDVQLLLIFLESGEVQFPEIRCNITRTRFHFQHYLYKFKDLMQKQIRKCLLRGCLIMFTGKQSPQILGFGLFCVCHRDEC